MIEGHDLEHGPRPKGLADDEDEGLGLPGRWVNSHDLLPGDILATADGERVQVTSIEQTLVTDPTPVVNLTIEANPNFSVGNAQLLVHNTSPCDEAQKGLPNPGSARFKQLQSLKKRLRNLGPGNTSVRGTNKTLAAITSAEADYLGKAFVGDGHRVNSAGFLISKDGTRLYRPPSLKPGSPFTNTGKQANFIIREFDDLTGKWKHISNGHIDILD